LNDDLQVTEAYAAVMELVGAANKYIEQSAPWALAKDPRTAFADLRHQEREDL
jgi:methionyl-tRNA synthetase